MPFKKIRPKRKNHKRDRFSVIGKLERELKINENFKNVLNKLTLEEVIAVKLELAAKASGGNIYGIPIWFSLKDIVKDACLKFALSAARTKSEAARFLGLNYVSFQNYLKKYDVLSYFEEENTTEIGSNSKKENFLEPHA